MLITVKQAAEIMKVSPQRVRQLIAEKRLKAILFGRDWLMDHKTVEAFKPKAMGRHRKS